MLLAIDNFDALYKVAPVSRGEPLLIARELGYKSLAITGRNTSHLGFTQLLCDVATRLTDPRDVASDDTKLASRIKFEDHSAAPGELLCHCAMAARARVRRKSELVCTPLHYVRMIWLPWPSFEVNIRNAYASVLARSGAELQLHACHGRAKLTREETWPVSSAIDVNGES